MNNSASKNNNHLITPIITFLYNSISQLDTLQNYFYSLSQNPPSDMLLKKQFREKIHIFRDSELTVLFKSEIGIKSLYYLLLSFLFWGLLWVIFHNYQNKGNIIDYSFWLTKTKGFYFFFKTEFILIVYSSLIVVLIQLVKFFSNKYSYINYYFVLTIYFLIQICICIIVYFSFVGNDSSIAVNLTMGCEIGRIILKIHSYFREKMLYGFKQYHMKYILFNKTPNKDDIVEISISKFYIELKRFYYFFYCPSLIYRDTYPRLPKFRAKFFFSQLINFFFSLSYFYLLLVLFINSRIGKTHIKSYHSFPYFLQDCLRLSVPSTLILSICFCMILHTWMNLWSELLRHGDRRFYEDWWNCTNFSQYYRKWNIIVHEWLYYYIYSDLIRMSLGKISRQTAKMFVFGMSIFFHEFIVTLGIGFYYPILSIFFGGPGLLFTFIKTTKREFNVLFWIKMLIGPGIILVLYIWEINLRDVFEFLSQNKQLEIKGIEKIIPKIFLMYKTKYWKMILDVI
jgi:sterol O-acyltransferase